MSKELDYLDKILNYQPLTLVERTIIECIKEKIHRLEAIDNAEPSEALKLAELLECDLQATNDLVTRTINGYDYLDILETIEQALLKAEKEHNSVNLLMQELDCKDFAELRKYARCGYEKLNSFNGSKEFKIEIPESSLMDYNPVKHYLKWEDLEFKKDNEAKIKVRMGEHIYDLWYGSYKTGYGTFKQKCSLDGYEFDEDYDIDIFNDLHLERVE